VTVTPERGHVPSPPDPPERGSGTWPTPTVPGQFMGYTTSPALRSEITGRNRASGESG